MSARLDIMASTKPLITVVMDDEQLKRLDDFRFAFRFPSRGAAIRYLIDAGIAAETSTPANMNTIEQKARRRDSRE